MHAFELTPEGKHPEHFYTISFEGTYADLLNADIIDDIYFEINDDVNEQDEPAILRDHGKLIYIAPSSEQAYKFSKRIVEMESAWEENIILF